MFLRDLIVPTLVFLTPVLPAAAEPVQLSCGGVAKQGGLLMCTGPAETDIRVAGEDGADARTVRTDDEGHVSIGLTRTEPSPLILTAGAPGVVPISVEIEPRNDVVRILRGVDCDKVDPRTPEQMAHIEKDWLAKQAAYKIFHEGPGASQGFQRPTDGRMTSPFGPERKYLGVDKNGEPCESSSFHRGYDMAAPVGTPIKAPAPGIVMMAEPDMYFEGGAVFLDHGDGLISVFMHMSEIDVAVGDEVETGETVGLTGNTGRTTGPHLHWAVQWRNAATTERDGDFFIDPALLLELAPEH